VAQRDNLYRFHTPFYTSIQGAISRWIYILYSIYKSNKLYINDLEVIKAEQVCLQFSKCIAYIYKTA